MVKYANKKKNKKNITNFIPIILIFMTLLIGIGYASINSISLDVNGNVLAKAQEGVYITDVEVVSSNNATYGENITSGTFFSDTITLSQDEQEASSSQIIYKVYIYNSNDYDVLFYDAIYDTEESLFYTNPNIVFSIGGYEDGIEFGDVVKSKAEPTYFYVTFKYKDNILPDSNTLKFNINFDFDVKRCYITYLGDVANNVNYPSYIGNKENLDIELVSDIADIKVTTNDNIELDYDVYYDNETSKNRLLIENITSNINVEIYYLTQAKYIENTGTQYIDTKVLLNNDLRFSLDFKMNRTSIASNETIPRFIGGFDDTLQITKGCNFANGVGENIIYLWHGLPYAYNGTPIGINTEDTTTNITNITLSEDYLWYKNGVLIEGEQKKNNVTEDSKYSFLVFGYSYDSEIQIFNGAQMKLYGLKIWDKENKLVRDFIPCYSQTLKKEGLFDKVNHVFYKNSGTGNFIIGE